MNDNHGFWQRNGRLTRWLLPNPGTIILIVLLAIAVPTLAQQGPNGVNSISISTIPYQGRLAAANGTPITAQQNMEFRLYSTPTGGTPLWEEYWTGGNSVALSDGLFSVMLGSLNTNLTNVVQANNNLYLGVTVGTDGEMSPRVQLGSVPFSIWALSVADGSITTVKLASAAVTNDKIADGAVTQNKLGADVNLVPPDGSITTIKLADNAVTTGKIADGAVGNNDLAANAVTLNKMAANSVGSSQIVDSSIGTTDLANGSVTSPKINLGSGLVNGGAMAITSICYSRQNVPNATATISVNSNVIVMAHAVFDFATDANTTAVGMLTYNDLAAGSEAVQLNGRGTVSQVYRFPLSPGTYTLQLKVCKTGAGSARLEAQTNLTWFVISQ